MQATKKNAHAARGAIRPRGSARTAVLGFAASIRASTMRLNVIAALRAATMHTTINANCPFVGNEGGVAERAARNVASAANGSAKTVWLNLTISPHVRMVATTPRGGFSSSAGFACMVLSVS